jgi:hypothetical protein
VQNIVKIKEKKNAQRYHMVSECESERKRGSECDSVIEAS